MALGYKGEDHQARTSSTTLSLSGNMTVRLADGTSTAARAEAERLDGQPRSTRDCRRTPAAGSRRLEPWLGDEPFMLTYGDGVSDVDLPALLAFHRRTGSSPRSRPFGPPSRFGGLSFGARRAGPLHREAADRRGLDQRRVHGPRARGPVLHRRATHRASRATCSSRSPRRASLVAFRHEGFWQCMDTIRDVRYLRGLWADGNAPWRDMGVAGGRRIGRSSSPAPAGCSGARWPDATSTRAPRSSASTSPGDGALAAIKPDGPGARSMATFATRDLVRVLLESTASTRSSISRPRRSSARPSIDPVDTFEHNIQGIVERSRGLSRDTRRHVHRRRIDRQGVRRPVRATVPGGHGASRRGTRTTSRRPATDLLAQTYAATYGLPIAITRCGNMYGGGDHKWSRIVPGTIRSVLEGERAGDPLRRHVRPRLLLRGRRRERRPDAGRRRRDRADVKGEAFNFAGRDRVTVLEIVRTILALMGTPTRTDVRRARPDRDPRAAGVDGEGASGSSAGGRGSPSRRASRKPSTGIGRRSPPGMTTGPPAGAAERAVCEVVLDLGSMPLANALVGPDDLDRPEARFPLALAFCPQCSLAQITETVPPEALFRDYLYFSSVVRSDGRALRG